VLVGLTLHEIVPQYHVRHLHKRGGNWQDEPSFLIGDCPWYRTTLLSLLHDGDLDLKNNFERKQYSPGTAVAQGQRGEWYPKHTILMPIAALPFYAVARDRGLLVFNVVQISLLVTLMWFGARRYTSMTLATAIALWFAFGTMLRPAAYNFAPDVFSSLLVTGGLLAVMSERAVLAGLLLGLAVWSKWTNVVFLPLPGLYLLMRRDFPRVVQFGIAAVVPILGLLALNYHMFGDALVTPYDRVLVQAGKKLVLEPSHRTFFNVPFWTGLWEQLTDKELGLIVACPPLLLTPIGAYLMARRAPADAVLIFGACVAQLAAFAKYEQWSAASYGPRFLMTVVALAPWLVAPVVARVFSGVRPLGRSPRRA
jgi:hypothetical protein